MLIVENLLLCITSIYLLAVAREDFQTFRIRNKRIVVLIGLYLLLAIFDQFSDIKSSIAAAAFLFSMGFAFWCLGLMGAGDVKLYLVVGLLTGWENLLFYVLWLIVFSLMLLILLKAPVPKAFQHIGFWSRVMEIKETKHAPYGVPISLATIVVLLSQVTFFAAG